MRVKLSELEDAIINGGVIHIALNTLHAEIERLDRAYWQAAICYLAKTDPLAFVHIDIDPRRLRPSPARAEGL